MTKTNAIIYVRVSDPNQVSGTSLEFQEQECSKYCERTDMEVAAVFREEGESQLVGWFTRLARIGLINYCWYSTPKLVDKFSGCAM